MQSLYSHVTEAHCSVCLCLGHSYFYFCARVLVTSSFIVFIVFATNWEACATTWMLTHDFIFIFLIIFNSRAINWIFTFFFKSNLILGFRTYFFLLLHNHSLSHGCSLCYSARILSEDQYFLNYFIFVPVVFFSISKSFRSSVAALRHCNWIKLES